MPEFDKFGEGFRPRMIAETLLDIAAKTGCQLPLEHAEQIAGRIIAEELEVCRCAVAKVKVPNEIIVTVSQISMHQHRPPPSKHRDT